MSEVARIGEGGICEERIEWTHDEDEEPAEGEDGGSDAEVLAL